MKRFWVLVVIAVLVIAFAGPVFAAKDTKVQKKDTKAAAAPQDKDAAFPQLSPTAQQEREALVANINNMNNQQLRVAVLQQLLNEEVAKLRNVQAVFCDQYGLDIEKFRNGLYRYDDKAGKFVEVKQ